MDDFLLDFNRLMGGRHERSVAYAVWYLHSENDQLGLLLKIGSDDQAKVFLDGREVYRSEEARGYAPNGDVPRGVQLRAGHNVLVLKVVNETGAWQGSIWLTDAAGQPVKGLTVLLEPE